jgi:5-methylcytosine-specific restriction endonuclease McrA
VTAKYTKAVHERDRVCVKCGWPGSKDNPLQVHHKRPRCLGGTSDLNNLELLCARCHANEHLSKGGYPQPDKRKRRKNRKGGRHR